MAKITLILGGIKSGKTSYAQNYAKIKEGHDTSITYLATAEALDDEMIDRIKRHQSDRPTNWITVEEPINITNSLKEINSGVVILDCLTLWITNKICAAGEDYVRDDLMGEILNDVDLLLETLTNQDIELVIVSNQVETGLISTYAMGRLFQDLTGLIHQKIAKNAKNVILMVAGIPQTLKGEILL